MKYLWIVMVLVGFSAHAASDYTILKVGDKEIKKSEVAAVWNGLFPGAQAPNFETFDEQVKQNVLRGVVSEYLLYDEAQKQDLQNSPEVEKQLDALRRKVTVKALLDKRAQNAVSQREVKDAYDKMIRELRDKEEMRARHILVDSEDKAKELLKQINDGADFEELAKENSMDKGSARVGGDLGFFTEDKMVKPFSEAAFKLDEGELSEPVKSRFGWHIIKAGERRDVKAPTYTAVKDQLQTELEEKKLDKYIEDLIDKTSITYYGADGNKKEFSKVPDSTN